MDNAPRVKARRAAPKTAATPRSRAITMACAAVWLVRAMLIGLEQIAIIVILITMDLIVELVCKEGGGAKEGEEREWERGGKIETTMANLSTFPTLFLSLFQIVMETLVRDTARANRMARARATQTGRRPLALRAQRINIAQIVQSVRSLLSPSSLSHPPFSLLFLSLSFFLPIFFVFRQIFYYQKCA